jgi:hypothetical protein
MSYLNDVLKKNIKDQIYKDLIIDSLFAYFKKKVDLDFILEILKVLYEEKEIKLFLKSIKIENIQLTMDFNYKDYETILRLIENKPQIIVQHCSENEDKNQYYMLFYTLLLFVRLNYDMENANKMLENKNLWEYFIQIIPDKSKFFPKFKIPNELLNKIFERELTVANIDGILNLYESLEKILMIINDNIEAISDCYLKEKKTIFMSSFQNQQKNNDNIEKISYSRTNRKNYFI